MSKTTDSVEEAIERRKQETAALHDQLAAVMFDGPHEVSGGGGFDPLSARFGGGPTKYAICLECAAMVRLGDAEERGGQTIERSIRIHREWHAA